MYTPDDNGKSGKKGEKVGKGKLKGKLKSGLSKAADRIGNIGKRGGKSSD